ncbi:MAG: glycosyltransferase [Pseudomonadota bacterium]
MARQLQATGFARVHLNTAIPLQKRASLLNVSAASFVLLAQIARALFAQRKQPIGLCYFVLDGGHGIVRSMLVAFCLRLAFERAVPVLVSVRSFRHLRVHAKSFAMVLRLLPQATVLLLCSCMAAQFAARYGWAGKSAIGSNAAFWPGRPVPNQADGEGAIHVLFLSNILPGKGLDVFASICQACAGDADFAFHVVGAPRHPSQQNLYDALRMLENTTLHGPLDGPDKEAVLADMDVFLFPSSYRDEAQPNIVFECAAFGIVPITTDIGCTGEDVDALGGAVVPSEAFHRQALALLRRFANDRQALRSRQTGVHAAYQRQHQAALSQWKDVCDGLV